MSDEKERGEFWLAFAGQSSVIKALLAKEPRRAFDVVEGLLAKYGYGYSFDLTEDNALAVLILTPEGDVRLAGEIDMLLQSRPEVQGWQFYGRRQAKPLSDALAVVRHIYGADASAVRVRVKHDAGELRITMCGPVFAPLSDGVRESLVLTLLDHTVGEEWVMGRRVIASGVPDSCVDGEDLSSFVQRADHL